MGSIFSWQTLWYLSLILYIPACIGLILVVLLQKGKGVGFAGAFGMGGGSDTIFGPRATKSLPQRLTYVMAGVFMVLALLMSIIVGRIGTGVAPGLVDEPVDDYAILEDLGVAVEVEPAPGAVMEQQTEQAGEPISPALEAPVPAQPSPSQGTPPAVPVPPVPPVPGQ